MFPISHVCKNGSDRRFATNTVTGRSKSVDEWDVHMRTQIQAHAYTKASYSLVTKPVNVGVALLVYAKDDTIARRVCDVRTQWTACVRNKGAIGVRFRVADHGSKARTSRQYVHGFTQPLAVSSAPISHT